MKIVILHDSVSNDTQLINSFNSDCCVLWEKDFESVDKLITHVDSLNLGALNNICFVYHFPGYHSLPYFRNTISGEDKYFYVNDNLIELFKKFKIVDVLSCNLNNSKFAEEIKKIEDDLNVDIRYSVNKSGNNPNGDWILESDGADVRNIYFTDNINNWNGVLNDGIVLSGIDFTNSNVIEKVGTTYKLLNNITWSVLVTALAGAGNEGILNNRFIQLGSNEIFDGNNKVIDLDGITTSGLFATGGTSIDDCSEIKNLGVTGGSLNYFGGYIIRELMIFFKVSNCHSTGNINAPETGGICGNLAGENGVCTITNCYSTGNISGEYSGGICGSAVGSGGECAITNCYSTGNISGEYSGGICGAAAGAVGGVCTVTNCYSEGDITIGATYAGGICGSYSGGTGECTVINCHSTGNISGLESGGICGAFAGAVGGTCSIIRCYSTGDITSSNRGGGGICGSYVSSYILDDIDGIDTDYGGTCIIQHCYATGNIQGEGSGGICGKNMCDNLTVNSTSECTIEYCYTTGSTSGANSGGICGSDTGSTIGNIDITVRYNFCESIDDIIGSITDGAEDYVTLVDNHLVSIINKSNDEFDFLTYNGYLNIGGDGEFYYDTRYPYPQLIWQLNPINSQTSNNKITTIDFDVINSGESKTSARHSIVDKLFEYYEDIDYFYCNKSSLGLTGGANIVKVHRKNTGDSYAEYINVVANESIYVSISENENHATFSYGELNVYVEFLQTGAYRVVHSSEFNYRDGDKVTINGLTLSFGGVHVFLDDPRPIPCLTEDTLVLTPDGYKNITKLKTGDSVKCEKNRTSRIRSIFSTIQSGNSQSYPYIIPSGSIARNYPKEQIKLSGDHLIKYKKNWILPRKFKLSKR
ncbi:MAG: hypothetical protein EBQ92_03155, partial [Proteobacteria bacterium]|nr:hypothetical protein [Pseudomonadota bacterium]